MEDDTPKNTGNSLRLYDCLKVKCIKECSEACCKGWKHSVIEDLTAQNADYQARAEAAENEAVSLKKFLGLFSWQSKGESFESTVNSLRLQLLDAQAILDSKTRMYEMQIRALDDEL